MTPAERDDLVAEITQAIREADHAPKCLTEDEQRWVRLAIQVEAQRAELRQAIIEKSITSLVWSAIVGIGYMLLSYATSHGYKP